VVIGEKEAIDDRRTSFTLPVAACGYSVMSRRNKTEIEDQFRATSAISTYLSIP